MLHFKQAFIILFILMFGLSHSQKSLAKQNKHKVIERVKELIDSNYVFSTKATRINHSIDSLIALRKYNNVKDPKAFADVLTNDLVKVSKDKHFVVQYRPDLSKARHKSAQEQDNTEEPEELEETIDLNLWYAQKTNFGFEKLEILEGNVGYIKLTFFDLFEWVKPTIDGAMTFITNTDALIIDLRGNGGGYSSATYLGSYFFDEQPMLWSTSYNRPDNATEATYTYKEIDGPRYLNKPIYILVDDNSFSRAEGFAYAMKHFRRATIVGQTTPGAAHGINFIEVGYDYFIQVPVEHHINPVTKTDWEGVGVVPHIKTKKEEALNIAYIEALNSLIADTKDKELGMHYDKLKKRYKAIKEKLIND